MAADRNARHWIWLPVLIVVAFVAWIVASEYFWRHPEQVEDDTGALIQPASVPEPGRDAERARPDNSGRDATGNAVSRRDPAPDAAVG